MTDKGQILVVDDNLDLREALSDYLGRAGFEVLCAENGGVMWQLLNDHHPDLIILDIMMPGEDGLSACKRLSRESNTPILMLTALGDADDRISGLDSGADDYLAKPFNPRELVARINAILRRTQKLPQIEALAGKTVRFAHLELDYDGRNLKDADGRRTQLTYGELKLLSLLLERPRMVLSRDELLEMSTGRTAGPLDRTIDNQISRLRRKIEQDVLRPSIIATVRHGGYSLSCDVEVLS